VFPQEGLQVPLTPPSSVSVCSSGHQTSPRGDLHLMPAYCHKLHCSSGAG